MAVLDLTLLQTHLHLVQRFLKGMLSRSAVRHILQLLRDILDTGRHQCAQGQRIVRPDLRGRESE